MKTNKVTLNELANVRGGIVEKTNNNVCGKCGSVNLEKITKSEGCSSEYYYHCRECGYEDSWENSQKPNS